LNKLAEDQRVLWVEQVCARRGCDATRRKSWAQGWDQVKVEFSVHPIRPDIALLKEGRVIAAIEVFVSHAVDPKKEKSFTAQGIKWIEVLADEMGDWQPSEPLPYLRLHPNPFEWQPGEPLPYLHLPPTPSDWWECQQCYEEEKQKRDRIRQEEDRIRQREMEEKQRKEQRWQREMQALVQKKINQRKEFREEREKQLVIEQRAQEMGETAEIEDSILSDRQRLGICKHCGTETRDWWSYDYATRICKCRPCLRNGKW
jgi:hypothetical protein